VTLPDGAAAPEGLAVAALVEGVAAGEGVTREYEGHTVYTLHVLADDPDTPAREGGRAGDAVALALCGVALGVEGVWQGGTNTRLDLTVPEGLVCRATPTPSPSPTATLTRAASAASPAGASPQEALRSPTRAVPAPTLDAGLEAQGHAAALPVAAEGEPAQEPRAQARSGGLDGALLAALVGTVAVGALVVGRLRGALRG